MAICFAVVIFSLCLWTAHAKVKTPPLITRESKQSITFKIGESLELACLANGVPPPVYRWMRDGRVFDISGNENRINQQPNSGTIVMNNPLKKDEGVYQCFAENQSGKAVTQKTILLVAQLDEFARVITPTVHYRPLGESLTLPCTPPKSIPQAELYWTKVMPDRYMMPVVLDNRVTMDTYGNLHFTNLRKSDEIAEGGRYQCTASNRFDRKTVFGNDQVIKVSGEIPMGAPPKLLWATPDNRPIAIKGTTFSMKCIFSGEPTPRVTWTRTGAPMGNHVNTDSFGQELVFNIVKFEDAGRYECEGRNDQAGNPVRKPFLLRVESKPYWIEKPVSSIQGEHENVTLRCSAGGYPTPEIKWFINGVSVTKVDLNPRRTVTPNAIIYTDLHLADTEVVQCNASNSHGYIFTNAYVTVLSVEPSWKVPPAPRVVFIEGQTVNLTCEVEAAPKALISWTKDHVHLTGGPYRVYMNGNLQIERVVSTDAGIYTCKAVNRYGNLTGTSEVIIRGKTMIVRHPENVWISSHKEAKFICTATTDPENLEQMEMLWYKDGSRINFNVAQRLLQNNMDNSLTITDVSYLDNAKYTCVARTRFDQASAHAYLKVRGRPFPPVKVTVDCVKKKQDMIAVVSFMPSGTNYAQILAFYVQYNTSFTPDTWSIAKEITDSQITKVDVKMSPFVNYTFRVIAMNRLGRSDPSQPTSEICTTPPAVPSENPRNVKVRGTMPTNLVIYWTPMLPVLHNGVGFKYTISWECVDEVCKNSKWPDRYRGQTEIVNYLQNSFTIENQLTYKRYKVIVSAGNERGQSNVTPEPVYGYSGRDVPSVRPENVRVDENSIGSTTAILRWYSVPNDPYFIRGNLIGYIVKYWHSGENRRQLLKMETFLIDDLPFINTTHPPSPEIEPINPMGPPGPLPDLTITNSTRRGDVPLRKRSIISVDENEVVVSVSNLPSYSTVEITVAVLNDAYVGPQSDPIVIVTKEGVPGPVSRLFSRRQFSNRIIMEWDPPTEPNGEITGYTMAHSELIGLELGDREWDPVIQDPDARQGSISGLRPSQKYRLYVYAMTAAGRGEVNFMDLNTISPEKPSQPSLSVVEVRDHSINITWVPSLTGNPGSVFYVQFKKTGRPNWQTTRVETLHNWMNLSMLDSGTPYEVRVVARNGMDQETASYSQRLVTGGYSSRLDSIGTHTWFIILFLLILVLLILFGVAIYWKKNRPLRYPDETTLNPLTGSRGQQADDIMYVKNFAYEKTSDSEKSGVDGSGVDRPTSGSYTYAEVPRHPPRDESRRYVREVEGRHTDYAETEPGPRYREADIPRPPRTPTFV